MKNLALIAFSFLFLCSSVFSDSLDNYLDYYVGADAQIRMMKFKKGFGHNLAKKRYPQGNIYAGVHLHENVAIEFGYESTTEKACDSMLISGDCCAGTVIPASLSPAKFKTKIKVKGPHIGLIFFYPLNDYPVKLFTSVGITSVKGTAEIKCNQLGNPPISGLTRTLSKHKEAIRVMAGAQYLTQSGIGFRTAISFINTRKIIIKKSDDNPAVQIPRIKLRDSIVYGLGAYWVF